MPNIIDSLFLELGIDTSKFSVDQRLALKKIAEFEAQAKRSAGKSADAINKVGQAFRDIGKVSGGAESGLGAMAKGIGFLLSPASLGIAAVSMLGKEVFDFNKNMTDANATLARNAELTGMTTTNLWAMGEAAKTVGGNPAAVQASIASLQTSLAGMSIGVGSAIPQMVGMARLAGYGARFNPGGFGQGVDEESLFKAARAMYKSQGRAQTMAFLTGYGLMGADQANLAMSPGGWAEYQKAQAAAKAMTTGGGFEAVVKKSLQSQVGIGEKDIAGAIAAEQAYGGIQGGMQSVVGLLTNIYGVLSAILGFIAKFAPTATTVKNLFGGANDADIDSIINSSSPKLPKSVDDRKALAQKLLMGFGMSAVDAATMVGSQVQESSMDPVAFNGSHVGLQQWDKTRRAAFEKKFGYPMGSSAVDPYQQFVDQQKFAVEELHTTHRSALAAMAKAVSLAGKASAFMRLDEVVNDGSFAKRFMYAQQMMGASSMLAGARSIQHNDNSSDIKIGDIHVHTNATDPAAHADAIRKGIATHPLVSMPAMGTVQLATRGMTG
jgi:Phage tail lysozyme